jgi:hypothetical protein
MCLLIHTPGSKERRGISYLISTANVCRCRKIHSRSLRRRSPSSRRSSSTQITNTMTTATMTMNGKFLLWMESRVCDEVEVLPQQLFQYDWRVRLSGCGGCWWRVWVACHRCYWESNKASLRRKSNWHSSSTQQSECVLWNGKEKRTHGAVCCPDWLTPTPRWPLPPCEWWGLVPNCHLNFLICLALVCTINWLFSSDTPKSAFQLRVKLDGI